MSLEPIVTSQASLQGLPRELRRQIYQHVFALDLDCTILELWKHENTQVHGYRSIPKANPNAKLVVPWVKLMLTCKDFAVELQSCMHEKAFLESEQNTSWCLDLGASPGGRRLGRTTWQRIPCHPRHLRVLKASFNTREGFEAWGDGGPNGITGALYQTLNFLVHCGPRFDCSNLLETPIHLAELRIKVERRDDPRDEYDDDNYRPPSGRETDPETILYTLGSIVGHIVNTGVLQGFVDMISVRTADKTLSWTPREVKSEGIPAHWDRYGFEWGEKAFSE